jgi:hypothetical protein
MYFHKDDITFHTSIIDPSIRGYILPHAGTAHTGNIISHTLRFKPTFTFKEVCVLYYPVSQTPNVQNKYYHEYYTPMKCIKYFIEAKWNKKKISYKGINLRDESLVSVDLSDTLLIVSVDFSHWLPLQKAINLETKAAHAIQFRQLSKSPYNNIVDHIKTIRGLYKVIPTDWYLQWVGRTRSLGSSKGVGYLSFLLKLPQEFIPPDGMFVTCYDTMMNARECLGEWFTTTKWSQSIETKLIRKVLRLGKSTSRLTGKQKTHIPITYYTVTYLYKDHKNFIRGYHGIKHNAFYLPEVLLEHVYPNGTWIQPTDTDWQDGRFMLKETLAKLSQKAGTSRSTTYQLYKTVVKHVTI